MNDYNKRCNYIAALIEVSEPKIKRERKDDSDKVRMATVKYHVEVEGLIQPDARGNFQKTTLAQEDKDKVRDFLLKIPAYESHYSRRDCGKKFVAPFLTITALYEEYKTTLPEASTNPDMNEEDFFDFAKLFKSDLQQRKQDVVGNSFNWRNVQWLKYLKSEPGIIFYKTSLDPINHFNV
ncbi:hypothetical protein J6590_076751 [Homalodisca vitripennis]|nr:hypothetical protein J6590_076751 [Homalodisca vitripennis]